MADVDLTAISTIIAAKVKAREYSPGEWYIRIRESFEPGGSKEVVESVSDPPDDPSALTEILMEIVTRKEAEEYAGFIHIEGVGVGDRGAFFTKTVKLTVTVEAIEPTEGAALAGLTQMGMNANKLLMDLVKLLLAAYTNSQQAEFRAAVMLAEASGRAEAGDDNEKWMAMATAAQALGPAFLEAAKAAQAHKAEADAAREERARKAREAEERANQDRQNPS